MAAENFFSPFDINDMALANRLAVAPMTRVSAAEDGAASEKMARYYERFARGGFGLLITEGVYTDREHSQGYIRQHGITDEAQAQAWRQVIEAAHGAGSKIVAQIMHAGAISQGNRFREFGVAPSSVQPKGQQMAFYYGKGAYALPAEITEEQIADAIEGFAASAARAVSVAGFDGVEIHGANGYLIDQFLTDYTNRRADRWGGDTRGRSQFLLAVFKAVRERVGASVPVGVRISQGKVNDFTHKWAGGERDAETVFGALADAGADYIHVTEFEAWRPAFEGGRDSLVSLARRYAPKAAIIANGGLHDVAKAAEILDQGADLVALGRGALANPDFPNRARAAREFRAFDASILGPIADIKERELAA